ncbi:methyltransferase domain-containing protein [Streptomyces sp. NPDC057939]|uniref:methyltransferase domain-containing protein n=1 Tax=Streptomyces sp. NPDC057939 TaxID=3346284 RepID=UPI0036E1D27F
MTVVIVRQVPEEELSPVIAAFASAGLDTRTVRPLDGESVPRELTGIDALVVIGGAPPDPPIHGTGPDAGLALLREALAAEVPVLGICGGAELLAVAAGGTATPVPGGPSGWAEVDRRVAAATDPLFSGAPGRQRVLHRHGRTVDLPDAAVVLASSDRYPVQAFRLGGSAWGIRFSLTPETVTGTRPLPGAPTGARAPSPTATPWRDRLLGRFAALVASRAEHTATRAFFTGRAAAWEGRFAHQTPAYESAVARLGLRPGQCAVDLGCGTGRAMPALRARVGPAGTVLGIDVTPAMLAAAARRGRTSHGHLLAADCTRLPLPTASVHGIFTAGLLDHLPDPAAALREWARVSARDGALLLFHPSGRAERAARHGRLPGPDDLLAEANLWPALRAAGWRPATYDDAPDHFLARATRD